MTVEGLTTIRSRFGPQETSERLRREITAEGMTLFASIDHAGAAAEVGLTLRPTELLIFGNAKGGTPLMQQNQIIGIDLPLKALIWEDEAGLAWISVLDPVWLVKRHGTEPATQPIASRLTALLHATIRKAAEAD
ncbi:MAG: DUF302 domain-containing protein [Dongiaceae bacterium]